MPPAEIKVEKKSKHSEIVEPNFFECVLREFDIKINYPSTWLRRDDLITDPNTRAMFQSPQEDPTDQLLESVLVSVDSSIGNMTLDTFIQGNIVDLRQNNPNFNLIESTATTLGGVPAHQIVFSTNTRQCLIVATIRHQKAYYVMYYSEGEKYQKFLSSAEQMISSFEFLS